MVFAPGSVGQASLSARLAPVLVMERLAGARSGNCGCSGGASTWASPNWTSVQLILVNNRKPLRAPLWPRRLVLLASLAATTQAVRCPSSSARQRAETRLRVWRASICAGERGLEGMARARLTWPNWPGTDTFKPRLPDCGMSNIFIRYLLSFVVLFVVVNWRAWPATPAKLRAPKCSGSAGILAGFVVWIDAGKDASAPSKTGCMVTSSCARPRGQSRLRAH